jgi:uroporphyrinogen decarboxylase
MKHRDRVIKALQFQDTDRTPVQMTFCPEFADRLREVYGIKDTHPHDPHNGRWNGYELEILTGQDALQCGIGWFINYYLDDQPYTDEWGVEWKIDEYNTPFGKGKYTNLLKGPLEDESAIENYEAPDPHSSELYTNLDRMIKEYKDEYYTIGRLHCTIFETAWALRGFENLLVDFYLNPEQAKHLLDIAKNYHLEVAKKMAKKGVDMIWLGDDIGSQDALLIPPEVWREFIKPRMAEVITAAKEINPEIKIAYHTDGNNYDIIPELIEIGVDVLNPIQTESMDPVVLKEKYGDRLCFFGAISVQSTLPFGTVEEIKQEFDERKNTLGKNGGWICAPTHHVQLDTPLENFFALLEAAGVDYTSPGKI